MLRLILNSAVDDGKTALGTDLAAGRHQQEPASSAPPQTMLFRSPDDSPRTGQGSGSGSASSAQTASIPQHISGRSTPPEMKVDRIPPRVDTWVDVSLGGTPDPAAPVTFSVEGQGGGNGSVTIDGGPTRDVSSSGKVTLKLQGVDQTDDSKHAGKLHLVARQGGIKLGSSAGFSVSSIPQDMEFEFKDLVKGEFRGIRVFYNWQSDSQNKSDLDKAPHSERVEGHPTGSLKGAIKVTGCYMGSTKRDLDMHAIGPAKNFDKPGRNDISQTFMFRDDRTGAQDIPMKNSGFVIEHVVKEKEKSKDLEVVTSKKGADTTAKDPNPKCKSGPITSKAGGGEVKPVHQDI